MPQYEGQCHCGQIAWTAEIPEEKHILCHCGACKLMGGGEFTLNQIIPKDNFKLTKGDLKVYTYKGDSGVYLRDRFPRTGIEESSLDLTKLTPLAL